MTGNLLVVGSVNVDYVSTVDRFPSPGETTLASSFRYGLGGKGANQAVAAALDGARVGFVATVGDDAQGHFAHSALTRWGVGVTDVRTVPEAPTGTAQILVDSSGENIIVVNSGANALMGAALVDGCAPRVREADAVLTQGELPVAVIDRLAAVCAAEGTRFILNLAPPRHVSATTLATADPLVLNEHEARSLGLSASDAPDGWARVLADAVPRVALSVVVTLGAAGAIAVSRDGNHCLVRAPRVDAVDTTGAGDAFCGVLAARLAAEQDLGDAVRDAVEAGAYAVRTTGTVASYRRRTPPLE